MTRRVFWLTGVIGVMAFANIGSAQTQDRFWILWERVKHVGQHCPGGAQCAEQHTYSSRPLETNNSGFIYRLFGLSSALHKGGELPLDHPDAPLICRHNQAELTQGFDPETLPKSEKIEVLRGVSALHMDLSNLKAPPGFSDTFGAGVHAQFVSLLQEAGIRIVDADALALVPGQPVLNLYFSFSDPEDLCDYQYSVFASLSQEVLLARDLRIKVSAGVWSYSTGSTALDHVGNEADAILRVAEAFVRDHRQVNAN